MDCGTTTETFLWVFDSGDHGNGSQALVLAVQMNQGAGFPVHRIVGHDDAGETFWQLNKQNVRHALSVRQ